MSESRQSRHPALAGLASLVVALALAALGACSSQGDAATGPGGKPADPSAAGQKGGPGGAKRGPTPVTVAPVETADVPDDIEAIGHVEAAATVQVIARVGGELGPAQFKEGDLVKAGQVLFTLDARPYDVALQSAKAKLVRDQALSRNADISAARYGQLGNGELVARQDIDTARANAAAAKATVESDQADVANAELNLSYTTITAPITGRTGPLMIFSGNIVRANDTQPIVEIRQTTPVRVVFSLPERYLPQLRARMGSGDVLEVTATPHGDGAKASKGTLAFSDNTVDVQTGTINLRAVIPNDDQNLWPGQYVDVTLRLVVDKNQVVVPAAAVQVGQQGSYVYVVGQDKKVQLQVVTIGRTEHDVTTIAKGLTAGQTVVLDGQQQLSPGAEVQIATPPQAAHP